VQLATLHDSNLNPNEVTMKDTTDYAEIVKRLNAVTLEKSYLLEERDLWVKGWCAEGRSLREVGKLSGLSFSRVRQILDGAQ
jgi:DNA-directed RNA polymerase sigma subunit (sigma70/sigma32)|tara:strand:+ start:523 stop:768 length:246 start_codon:yes stop_codon:yes gene_type:complete